MLLTWVVGQAGRLPSLTSSQIKEIVDRQPQPQHCRQVTSLTAVSRTCIGSPFEAHRRPAANDCPDLQAVW